MQKARGQSTAGPEGPAFNLPLLVSTRFQVLFHSPPGDLFTFPSRYWFTIGCPVMLSLRRWSSQIPTGFPVSRSTWVLGLGEPLPFRLQGYHFLRPTFPGCSARTEVCNSPAGLHTYRTKSRYPGCTTHAGFNVQTGLG
jgi:hypothetical protein